MLLEKQSYRITLILINVKTFDRIQREEEKEEERRIESRNVDLLTIVTLKSTRPIFNTKRWTMRRTNT